MQISRNPKCRGFLRQYLQYQVFRVSGLFRRDSADVAAYLMLNLVQAKKCFDLLFP